MKCTTRSFVTDDDNDRISRLPDDVLVGILSLLLLKEAGRTSVLSYRWINLWKHIPSLDFDPGRRSELIGSDVLTKYLKWVDSVISSHKSPTLKQFRISFPLSKSNSNSITRWLEFAFSKHVQRLELDFCIYFINTNRFPEGYLFAPPTTTLSDFKSLKALSFKSVDLSGGAIEFFLRNCPLLEQLIVHSARKLSKLEVCGSSLVLKHLEIVRCPFLKSLKVAAPSLTSLTIMDFEGVSLENIPTLVDVSITCKDNNVSLKSLLSVFSCCISRLETLHIMLVSCHDIRKKTDELCKFAEMTGLKKLVVEHYSFDDESLSRLAFLIRISPNLEEFVLKSRGFDGFAVRMPRRVYDDDDNDDDIWCRHEHLKVFEFCGYNGRTCDDALVECILKNCIVLEKIIIDPCIEYSYNRFSRSYMEKCARTKAKKHHVEFVIR
ncbi:PREDICTED: F-box protein At5g03100-like [Erythranthe guttata]|uniref:F-box protein At5g03100-like n=1 Tax=Erythranthe guttata TaxID=4155 RepID=UPI00064DE049|nr:PREDICTED: F-box protein At5g03100-like [Erythranthe guttata]|eukprot:XP_012840086.1 PREDICTED: F-box protein At5g03100-like [Erythranthe guttata]